MIRLIPDTKDPRCAVRITKGGVCVVDSGVQKTNQNIFAGKRKIRLCLYSKNAGTLKTGCVLECEKLRYTGISDLRDG